MTAATESLLLDAVRRAHAALDESAKAFGESRLHWLVQARVCVDEALAFAKAQGPAPTRGHT